MGVEPDFFHFLLTYCLFFNRYSTRNIFRRQLTMRNFFFFCNQTDFLPGFLFGPHLSNDLI